MNLKEALQTVLVDILSDVDFDEKVMRAKMLKRSRPLSQMGAEAKTRAETFVQSELMEAYQILRDAANPKDKGENDGLHD